MSLEGNLRLEVRAVLETDDGAIIYMPYRGFMVMHDKLREKLFEHTYRRDGLKRGLLGHLNRVPGQGRTLYLAKQRDGGSRRYNFIYLTRHADGLGLQLDSGTLEAAENPAQACLGLVQIGINQGLNI